MSVRLSKSKLIAFRQCPKRLWLELHKPEERAEDAGTERLFAIGHQVGDLARSQIPGGILIAPDNDLARAKNETAQLLVSSQRAPLFEATVEAHGILVRLDLLIPEGPGWHLVEVKSATSCKDYHLDDLAIQTWVAREAGISASSVSLQLVDSSWVYPGEGKYEGIFKRQRMEEAIGPPLGRVEGWLQAAGAVAQGPEPSVRMGGHCSAPFECGYQTYCSRGIERAEKPITWIPSLRRTMRESFEAEGITDIRQVDLALLSERQREIAETYLTGDILRRPLSEDVRQSVAGVRYHLDFETIQFAVPIWAGTKPYQQVPYQWSCHVEEGGVVRAHREFLDLSGEDPSRRFAESLVAAMGANGPVIVYSGFEEGRLRDLAERFPDLADHLDRIVARMVDLLPIVREHYFHPGMEGSWSIKNVLRTIRPDLDYRNLTGVRDGGDAIAAYLEAIEPATSAERRQSIRASLLEYCRRDTEAMIHVLGCLIGQGTRTA